MATEPKLTDEVRQEEPAAWLVFTHSKTMEDYRVFTVEGDANDFAFDQAEEAELDAWMVYPLHACEGTEMS